MSKARILIVEDDPLTLEVLAMQLRAAHYEVDGVTSAIAAIQATQQASPDLMILDLSLLEDYPFHAIRDGFGVLSWLRRTVPEADFPVIIHTASDSPTVAHHAQAHGAYSVFKKGGPFADLLLTIRCALDGQEAA